HDLLAGDATQGGNLPADRLGNTGHCQATAAVERTALKRRGMDKEADGCSRRGEPVTYRLGRGQHSIFSVQRLPDNAREEARGSQIGLAGSNADRRQPDRDSVQEAAAAVVGEEQLGDRLLCPVARLRSRAVVVVDHVWERGAEHRDRRAEHDTRAIVESARPNSVEEEPRSVDVDAVALLEIELRLTTNPPPAM